MIMTHVDLIEKLLKYDMLFTNNTLPHLCRRVRLTHSTDIILRNEIPKKPRWASEMDFMLYRRYWTENLSDRKHGVLMKALDA